MRIVIDGSELSAEARRVLMDRAEVLIAAQRAVRAQAFRTKARVQTEMPIDTGRARASWGSQAAPPPAQAGDGIWDEKDNGLTVIQGSNVEYIPSLNEGSSKQAPAGFIDAAAADAIEALEDELLIAIARALA